MLKKIIKAIKNPKYTFYYIKYKKDFRKMDDEKYLKLLFKFRLGYKLNLDNPRTFNEKLQWLKLYDRNPEYTKMVDKYEVRKYISKTIGEEYLIPLYGVYDKYDDIDFSKLPNQFVIKPNHTSGNVFICKDKTSIDYQQLKITVDNWMKREYYWDHREWPYKNIIPKLLVEKYMEDNIAGELIDYKLYCFNGKCEYVMACFDRYKDGVKFFYYDKDWNKKKEFSVDGTKYGESILLPKPQNLDKMFKISKQLSKGIPFVRIDLYEVNGALFFGEFTFFPSAGFDNTRPDILAKYLSKSLIIKKPTIRNQANKQKNID